MSLSTVLNLMAFNTEYERFYEVHGDNLDTEDIQDMITELKGIWTPADLKKVNACDSPDEAFYFVDMVAQQMQELALHEFGALDGITKKVFEILVYGDYSHRMGWFEDWEDLEARIFDFMPNEWQKNYLITPQPSDDEANFNRVMRIIARRFLNLLWFDLIGVEIPVVEKFRVLEAYREEYEPDLEPFYCYGEEWLLFEDLMSANQYHEILSYIADRENELNLVEFDQNGNKIYGESWERDYLHLLSPWVSKAMAWGGY